MPTPAKCSTRKVRFVSPGLRADQRALTVEAIAANADGRLKPGMFATARIQQPAGAPALLVPAAAVETIAGTSRVYVVKNNRVEERIVTIGETVGDRIEITTGVAKGEAVAAEPEGTAGRRPGRRRLALTVSHVPIGLNAAGNYTCSGSPQSPSAVPSSRASSSCR